jgi:hypothetical protein
MANSARHEFETRTDKKNPAAMDGVKREFIFELENTCRRRHVNPRPESEKSNAATGFGWVPAKPMSSRHGAAAGCEPSDREASAAGPSAIFPGAGIVIDQNIQAKVITPEKSPAVQDSLKANGKSMESIEAGCVWQRKVPGKEALRIVRKASKKNRRRSVFSTGGFVFKSAD